MISIFFDLETTDTLYIGQILNYSFIAVDDEFKILSECSGLIKINRLQLPTPGAVIANRINVIEHQKMAQDFERDAGCKITDYLKSVLESSTGDVRLIGFNSTRFDVPFLRTTLIRNGIDPYIRKGRSPQSPKIIYGDLLHVARKLVTSTEEFSLITLKEDPVTGEISRSLTLQHLTQQLGVLSGVQLHESREDVLLTIELAKVMKSRFGVDVRFFSPYEGTHYHPSARKGSIVLQRLPEYDLSLERSYSEVPVTLLDFSASGALWIDLMKFDSGDGKQSIIWKNTNDGFFFASDAPKNVQSQYSEIAKRALSEFNTLSLKNYFKRSVCDIEQDIYRLDFNDRDLINNAINSGDNELSKNSSNPDVATILKRYKLANYKWGGTYDDRVEHMLKAYALYRYGGEALVEKHYQPGADDDSPVKHQTLSSYIAEIESRLENCTSEDSEILNSLVKFYKESDICRVAGIELGFES